MLLYEGSGKDKISDLTQTIYLIVYLIRQDIVGVFHQCLFLSILYNNHKALGVLLPLLQMLAFQPFALKHIKKEFLEKFPIDKAYFNYDTESFISKEFTLPYIYNEDNKQFSISLIIAVKNQHRVNK